VRISALPRDFDDVELFVEGHYQGRDWTAADLRQAYDNWLKFNVIKNADGSQVFEPPVWLGHEELPDLAKKTNTPQFGDADQIRLVTRPDGRLSLRGRLHQVHNDLAQWIDERKIRRISAEFYPNWKDSKGQAHGVVIRRVGLLGGTPPEVKEMNTLPALKSAAFSDGGQETISADLPFTFSDRSQNMNRAEIEGKVIGIAKQRKLPVTEATIKLLPDAALTALHTDLSAGTADTPPDIVQFSDQVRAVVTQAADTAVKSALSTALTAHKDQIDAAARVSAARLNEEKAATVKTLLDWATDDKGEGARVKPAVRKMYHDRLMRADAINPVVKLSDADGKNERTVTEFEAQCAEIRALPVVRKFSDEIQTTKDGKAVSSLDQVDEDAKAYAERRNKQLTRA
jgi:hypothetical protein